MSEKKVFKLSQLCTSIENFFSTHLGGKQFWIKAEISSFSIHKRSGHAYVELIEEVNQNKIASIKANIWSKSLDKIRGDLGKDFENVLKDGVEIVFLASVRFHKVYGLSLIISEVDISFNLGELERRKQATIKTLKEEGLFDLNKQVALPVIVQRVALIGAPGTAGFNDFINHIDKNEKGYKVYYDVYKSSVQGDRAPVELLLGLQSALKKEYDAIVIIRGGGSKLDLDAYNELNLCREIANSPVPIISGIGHETDISVVDMISHSPVKTPTAAAGFILDRMVDFEARLYNNYILIARHVHSRISRQKEMMEGYVQALQRDPISKCQLKRGKLHTLTGQIVRLAQETILTSREDLSVSGLGIKNEVNRILKVKEPQELENIKRQIIQLSLGKVSLSKAQLESLANAIEIVHPSKTISRGFSIARLNGKAINNIDSVKISDRLVLEMINGSIEAEVKKINNEI